MKKFRLFTMCTVCALLLQMVSFSMQAQLNITPVPQQFQGEWVFDRAQAQEKALNTKDAYATRTVTMDDLRKENCFWQTPTLINFIDENMAAVETAGGGPNTFIPAFNPKNDNSLELINPEPVETDDGEMEYVTSMPVFFNLAISGNAMSMEYTYVYRNAQGGYTEGVLTIFYKR